MKKKVLAMILAAMMFSVSACGNTPSGNANQPQDSVSATSESQDGMSSEAVETETPAKEPMTFQIAVDLHPLNKDEDLNNREAFKAAEEATGVHIEWIPIAPSDAGDKVNIMLASDLPDAFLGTMLGENSIAANMDSFVNLAEGDLLQTHAPHVVADYETISGGLDLVTWPDGSIRTLMTGKQTSYENDGEGILFMNKDWLDKVGMDAPTTTEEFYKVLCAFRDGDMNGNGDTTDEIPYEPSQRDWCSKIMNVANPWGIAGTASGDATAYKMAKDGQVVGTVNTEEFRDFLEWCHMLAEEGLVGSYYTWSPYADMGEEEASHWVVVGAIDAPGGSGYQKTGSQDKFAANRTGFAITTTCKDPGRLLEWWDYLSSSTEMKYTCRFGPKGGAWDMDENGNVYDKMPENLTEDFNIENYKYTYGMVDISPLILKDEVSIISKEDAFTSWYREECVREIHNYLLPVEKQIPTRFVDADKVSERTFIETELFSAIQTFIATSVTQGVDDASWESYLAQLDALQYDEWLQWYQDFLDKKF